MNHSKYRRIDGHADFDSMQDKTLVVVGVGASSFLIEQITRLAIGRVILIDPDIVEPKNLTSQNWQHDDISSYKVHAMKRRLEQVKLEDYLLDITTFPYSFTDAVLHDDFSRVVIHPEKTLILGMTDNFFIQEAVHAFAIASGITVFLTGNYSGGGCGEIAIIDPEYPGNACFKCMVPSRYKAMYEQRERATGVVHSIMGHLLLDKLNAPAIPSKTYEQVMREGRNFIQVKLRPEFGAGTPDWGSFNGDGMLNFLTLFHKMEQCCSDCLRA